MKNNHKDIKYKINKATDKLSRKDIKSRIILKPGREKSLQKRHPWIFSGGIQRVEGNPEIGDTIEVFSYRGDFLARGFFSPHSQIRSRIWTWDEKREIDRDFFENKITESIYRRNIFCVNPAEWQINPYYNDREKPGKRQIVDKEWKSNKKNNFISLPISSVFSPASLSCNALRLVNSESDGLPGLIVDRYADFLVLQSLTVGVEKWKETIADILIKITGIKNIYERSDSDERLREGLSETKGVLRGDSPSPEVEIAENDIKIMVDIQNGHKTGFYLDQRENRKKLRDFCPGKSVLNCFCYTGGFTLNALKGGCERVVSVDASRSAMELAKKNLLLNKFDDNKAEWIVGDVFKLLREFKEEGKKFDVIILDPPKFASSQGQTEKALRGYKDINLLGLQLLNPGGFLFTFSCSGLISREMFQNAVAWAALDAGIHAQILHFLSQSPDHPISLNFHESAYLKGFIIGV